MNHGHPKPDVERMKPATLADVTKAAERLAELLRQLSAAGAGVPPSSPLAAGAGQTGGTITVVGRGNDIAGREELRVNEEALYQRIKARLLNDLKVDPIFLRLLATQPEIVVEIEPKVITLDTSSGKGRIAKLAADGFFDRPREPKEVRVELTKTGPEPNAARMSEALTALVNDGFLIRDDRTYQLAAGVKVSTRELSKAS